MIGRESRDCCHGIKGAILPEIAQRPDRSLERRWSSSSSPKAWKSLLGCLLLKQQASPAALPSKMRLGRASWDACCLNSKHLQQLFQAKGGLEEPLGMLAA